MMKKTIAILGDTGEFPPALLEAFAKQDLRLLYVSENDENKVTLKNRFNNLQLVAEVEFLSCERDGCWEADIIALTKPEQIVPALLGKIKEVTTQKIVLVVSGGRESANLDALFPYSKVVEVQPNSPGGFLITGNNASANAEVDKLLTSRANRSH